MTQLTFHDHKPKSLSFHDAVVNGLSKPRKSIPPKFFYDKRGSKLFDKICQQPEYYPPSVERSMLVKLANEITSLTGTERVLIEPGAGGAQKVRLLLNALRPSAFVPMDISFDYLKSSATQLFEQFPWLKVHAVCVDFTHSLPLPKTIPDNPRLLFFPGSSLGNFHPEEAQAFLKMARTTVGNDGMVLIGVDTKKDESTLNAAYNDAAGVTAEFNLNLLHRMQNELGAKCDPTKFKHRAFYNADKGRIEMHLVSKTEQEVRVNGYRFTMNEGETLHTENSYKYTPTEFLELAQGCGLQSIRHWMDSDDLFAMYLLKSC